MKKPKWNPSWGIGSPNGLHLDPAYVDYLEKNRDYVQYLAKKRDAESKRLIKPEWDKWPDTSPVTLWEAIALSLNVEPKHLRGLRRNPLQARLDFDECTVEFRRRLEIAEKRISELAVNPKSSSNIEETQVILSRLRIVSQSFEKPWKFPKEYPAVGAVRDCAEKLNVESEITSMEKGSVSNDRDSPRGKANGGTCENLDAVKFEEMVRRHEKNWPSIKQDLKEAKANGLRSAAKIRHGYYDESKAVQWAKNRGKYHEKPSSRSWCDVGLQT